MAVTTRQPCYIIQDELSQRRGDPGSKHTYPIYRKCRAVPNGEILRQNIGNPSQAQGVAESQILLLDDVAANDPGIWVPWSPFRNGSIEVSKSTGTAMVATISLMVSNAKLQPANSWQLTLGGTVTTGDVITVNINDGNFINGCIQAVYTVLVSDTTLDLVTTGLAAAINAAIATAIGKSNYLSFNLSPSLVYIASDSAAHTININWRSPLGSLTVSRTLSAGASETLAIAAYDYGEGQIVPGCALTALGIVAFDHPATWMKAKCTGYSAGVLSAIVQGNLP